MQIETPGRRCGHRPALSIKIVSDFFRPELSKIGFQLYGFML